MYGVIGGRGAGGPTPAPAVPPYVLPQHMVPQQQAAATTAAAAQPPPYSDIRKLPNGTGVVVGVVGAAVGAGPGMVAAAGVAMQAPSRAPPVPPAKEIDATQIAECMQEMRIKDTKERDRLESVGDLYSIIRTMDRLEKAFIQDQLNTHEYETSCSKLIAQFKATLEVLSMNAADLPAFMAEHELSCKAAQARFQIMVPATVEHGLQSKKPGQNPRDIAECVQHFITAMDSLRLNMVAIDQLHPIISDIVAALNKITALPPDFPAKTKMKEWLKILAALPASAELTDDQSRQLAFDLESSHNLFYQTL